MAKDHPWNLGKILKSLAGHIRLPGIRTPYAFYGTAGSVFAMHCEDSMLFSVNILLEGAAKVWYAIAAEHFDADIDVLKVNLYV